MKTFFCEDEEATKNLGLKLGAQLENGDVICLTGDLGMGKTALTKAMCAAQGADYSQVTSPSFALLNVYQGRDFPLRHFDLYRLNVVEELEDIGFAEALEEEGVSLIEWSDLFPEELPENYLQINLMPKESGREITLMPKGARYQELCEKV